MIQTENTSSLTHTSTKQTGTCWRQTSKQPLIHCSFRIKCRAAGHAKDLGPVPTCTAEACPPLSKEPKTQGRCYSKRGHTLAEQPADSHSATTYIVIPVNINKFGILNWEYCIFSNVLSFTQIKNNEVISVLNL